jgi:acyl-CoA synthetase (AMP-forming)/AMP-acid ligase II
MTVFARFAETARRHAERPWLAVMPRTAAALGIAAGEIRYAEAFAAVERLAARYREAGYGAGHRVGLLLENRPAFFLHWFALNALGASIVPLNPDLRQLELAYLIAHSEMVAIAAIAARHAELRAAAGERDVAIFAPDAPPPPVPVPMSEPQGEAALLYTSGTTGQPKGCVLGDEYFLAAGRWYASLGGLAALRPGVERMLTPLPLFHMNALAYSAMAMLETGGCLIPLDRFHPSDWWESVAQAGATVCHYLGVMPALLMTRPSVPAERAHALRFGFGAGVDGTLHAPFEARFGFPLIEAWAMTETGAGAVIAAHEAPRHVGTQCFGRPAATIDCTIRRADGSVAHPGEAGELLVRRAGPAPRHGFFRAYLKDPAATAKAWEGGWFHTGDVVRAGEDGSLHFIDRRRNVIRRSGENIAAVEVEAALRQHPAVAAVAIAAIADPLRGEEVFACIVAAPGHPADAALAEAIAVWCLDRLAYYKAPGYIAFVAALPLTATQKIQRAALQALVGECVASGQSHDTRSLKRRQA